MDEIARIFGLGVTRGSIAGALSRYGLKRDPKPKRPAPPPRAPRPQRAPYREPPPIEALHLAPPAPKAETTGPSGRIWTTRQKGECNWPLGEPNADMHYCCRPSAPGGQDAYCPAHRRKAYYPQKKAS